MFLSINLLRDIFIYTHLKCSASGFTYVIWGVITHMWISVKYSRWAYNSGFTYVTGYSRWAHRFHICDMTLIHMCVMTPIHMRDMTPWHVLNDMFIYTHLKCSAPGLICMRDINSSHVCDMTHLYAWHEWFKCVTWHHIGWLRLVGSLKSQVSFAKEPYKRDDILQKRPKILRSLLIVATPRSYLLTWSILP